MKKTVYILSGAIVYLGLAFLFSGYGNIVNHPNINGLIFEEFQNGVNKNWFDGFEQYEIDATRSELPGEAITARGTFSAESDIQAYNPIDWVEHGGYSADEPELHASFRHFYDPTRAEGDRYLHDHLDDAQLMSFNGWKNPKIDHIKWAIDHPDHKYNWQNATRHMVDALQTADLDARDEHMAFSWRALGETLHLIADMACPAHVRDDSHPSLFKGSYAGIRSYIGAPDYYEEIMASRYEGMEMTFMGLNIDEALKAKFQQAETVKQIAHDLAFWTNQNFFTHQTIYGSSVQPIIHMITHHKTPSLDDCSYSKTDFTYTKTIAGKNVIMCSDKDYMLGFVWKKRGYPKFTPAAAADQATVLYPQIREAGVQVVKLLIPKLSVQITSLTPEKISGKISHKTNTTYPELINYAGPVTLYRTDGKKVISTVMANYGSFEGEIELKEKDYEDGGTFYAEINFGGIRVKSLETSVIETSNQWEFAYQCGFWGMTSVNGTNVLASKITFNNVIHPVRVNEDARHFTATFSFDDPITFLDIEADGTIEFDATDNELSNLEVNMSWHKLSDGYRQTETFSIGTVPLTDLDGKLRTYQASGHNLFSNKAFQSSTNNADVLKYERDDTQTDLADRIAESILIYLRAPHK